MRELSPLAILLGVVIGLLFGAANAYIGLKVGLTVSASIPAAVMAVALFRETPQRGPLVRRVARFPGPSANRPCAPGPMPT